MGWASGEPIVDAGGELAGADWEKDGGGGVGWVSMAFGFKLGFVLGLGLDKKIAGEGDGAAVDT